METILQDIRFAARGMRTRPGFTLVAVVTLALGIGANTAVFSVVDAALLRPLPYREPDRLVHLWENRPAERFAKSEASYPDVLDIAASSRSLEAIAGYAGGAGMTATGAGRPERLAGTRVPTNFFDVLGVEPAAGRLFAEGDDAAGGEPRIVVDYDLWQRRFGGDPAAIGRSIVLNGTAYTVVGVLPRSFHFAKAQSTEIWLPLVPSANERERRRFHWLKVVGRLAPGATLDEASAELDTIARRLADEHPDSNANARLEAVPLRDELVGSIRPLLAILLGAVAVVLAVACANVAGLLVARATSRSREIAVRRALGASRSRVVRQLLVEGTLLSLAGGLVGAVWTQWGVALLLAAIPDSMLAAMPYLRDASVDARALAFALVVALATGLLFSLAPALHAAGADVHTALKERVATSDRGRSRLRTGLVVFEIALSLVLLVGAGLMVRSLDRLLATSPGFEPDRLLTFRISLPQERYATPARVEQLHQELVGRLASAPGVVGVATTDRLPLTGGGGTGHFVVRGLAGVSPDLEHEANMRTVSSGYFRVMKIPVVAGREFEERDRSGSAPVAVVNETLASKLTAKLAPDGLVGSRVVFSFDAEKTEYEIVGVVGDENVTSLDADVTLIVYTPQLQDLAPSWTTVARTTGDPSALAASVEREVWSLDEELAVYAVAPMERIVADSPSIFLRRYPALLIGLLSAIAIALSIVGIFGVVSYTVSQRTREIGVRVALGARRRDILRMVLGHGAVLVAAGIAIGTFAALAGSRLLSSLLFDTSPSDPATYAVGAALLGAVALLACAVPAWRASRIDPIVALRDE
jgi:putative ABC transport system permease protein